MFKDEQSSSYKIKLAPTQFSWAICGGAEKIEQMFGKNVAVFNVVSKTITVNGTLQQYEAALALMSGKHTMDVNFQPDVGSGAKGGDCPICLCEADNPIRTSCQHVYCLECFEGFCNAGASSSKEAFQLKCEGNVGTCPTLFTLKELQDRVSSSIFEGILKSSFTEHVQRHQNIFHYCPTPDCGYIYRCTTITNPPAYNCTNRLEATCPSCNARHGEYTCAEYKDIASGGLEALQKLKRELNIKDCLKCKTPMEKTEGCNHMTCGGCKAHICWVCMAVFNTSGPCYEHMNKVHGGIGLGLERFGF